MADNSTETPSEGHKKVRKKIDIYKTAVDVNEKQKELKKKIIKFRNLFQGFLSLSLRAKKAL